jgi:hypothetical protein
MKHLTLAGIPAEIRTKQLPKTNLTELALQQPSQQEGLVGPCYILGNTKYDNK